MQFPGTHARNNLPASLIILGVTVVIFFLQQAQPEAIIRAFALWPLDTGQRYRDVGFVPWQLVTYGFLHGGFAHLFFNMFALYMFGLPIERTWGTRRFLIYYFVCLVGAGLVQMVVAGLAGEVYPTIGASGAVFGLLLAFGMMYPNSTLMLLFPPIPMKAKYFVLGYGALTLFFGITGTASGIAHFAHLGGMLFGFGMIMYWRRRAYRR